MKKQNFEQKNEKIKAAFEKLKKEQPEKLKERLNLSWSNWGFGLEPLQETAARLEKAGLAYIELHGNHYTDDLGYGPKETLEILKDHNLTVAGICGMFSVDNDLSSNRPIQRQAALDYLRREIDFAAAVEPIRAEEVSFVHTVADAKEYIAADMLTNLHMADSNRLALGKGSLDLDTIIMALYCIGYNTEGRYVTPEPLGPGGNPYEALNGKPDKKKLDELVFATVTYFREREEELLT